MSATLIYTVDGNLGRILEVYDDRCVILSDHGRAEFLFDEISAVKFRNLSFFMSGYIKLEGRSLDGARHEHEPAGGGRLLSGENCFVFGAPPGPMFDQLTALMPTVYEYISERAKNAGKEEY